METRFENFVINKSFKITKKDAEELLNGLVEEYSGVDVFDFYRERIYNMLTTNYQKDEDGVIIGIENFPEQIELYRIIELNHINDFNSNELGRYWCYDKEYVREHEFQQNVGFDKKRAWYIITATFRKEDIDPYDTLEMLVRNIGEREIRIKKSETKPLNYKIEKY